MKILGERLGFGKTGALFLVGFAVVAIAGVLGYHYQRKASALPTQQLAIHEWGVNMPLPSNINDAYYVASTSTHDPLTGQPNTMWVGLSSLSAKGCDAGRFNATGASSPVGAIIRVAPTDTDPVTGMLYTQKFPSGVIVGGYYYVYIPWKSASCTSSSNLGDVNTAFVNAVKGSAKAAAVQN
jgi:hypothetical protein